MQSLLSFFFGSKRRIVLFCTALLLLFALLFCATVLPFLRHGPVVLSYKGLQIREGVFNYLYTFFRYKLPASFENVQDTDAFWRLEREDGQTNGEYYGKIALDLVFQTVAAARIYDSRLTLTQEERAELDKAIEETLSLTYKGGGSKAAFNEKAKVFGFTYEDFKTATLLLYKATTLRSSLYGENGGRLTEAELTAYLKEHFYHTVIIFVRTENKPVKDSQGNYLTDGNGQYITEELTPKEKAEKMEKVEAIRDAIADGTTEEEYLKLLLSYNEDADAQNRLCSYYFSEGNAYTTAFAKAFPTVKDAAMSLKMGEVKEVTSSVGTHFVFRTEIGKAPYNDRLFAEFFADLRTRAMAYLYQKILSEGVAGVRVHNQSFLDGLRFGDAQPNNALIIAYFHGYTISVSSKK